MNLTSTDWFNYLRCTRFAALDRERRKHGSSRDTYHGQYMTGHDGTEEADFYDHFPVRDLASLKQLFARVFLRDVTVEEERSFYQSFSHGISLKTTADFIVTDGNHGDVYTVVPVSSDVFLRFRHTTSAGKKEAMFTRDDDEVYHLIPETMDSRNYAERMKQMTDRHRQTGRLLFDQSFRKYVSDRQDDGSTYRYFLVMVNPNYIHQGGDAMRDLFVIMDVSDVAERLSDRLNTGLYRMLNHIELNDESRCPLVRKECMPGTPFACPFVPYCYGHVPDQHPITAYFDEEEGFLEKNGEHVEKHDTFDLLNEGIVHMLDVPISWLHRERNLMQRYCVENNYVYINKQKVLMMLDTLKEPLTYLYVGSVPTIIPTLEKERPFMQRPAWFSTYRSHDTDASPDIVSAVSEHRTRDDLHDWLETLLSSVDDTDGHVIVSDESKVLSLLDQLMRQFPDHVHAIRSLSERLFGLSRLLKNDLSFYRDRGLSDEKARTYNYYHPDLDGSYAIERLIDVFDAAPSGGGRPLAIFEAKKLARKVMQPTKEKGHPEARERLMAHSETVVRAMHAIMSETIRVANDK